MATRAALFLLILGWASALGSEIRAQPSASERPPSALEGVVVTDDAAAIPLRRVRVAVTWTGGEAITVFTDERGRFSVSVSPGAYLTIALTKAGYAAQRIGREPDGAGPVVLRLTKGGAITGTVIDATGAPVSRVAVRTRRTDADGKVYSTGEYLTATDDRGTFRIGSLPAGRYAVIITGGRPTLGNPADPDIVVDVPVGGEIGVVRIHQGAQATERLVTSFATGFNTGTQPPSGARSSSSGGVIEGRVLDEAGRGAPHVLVRAVAITGGISSVAAADVDGRYALTVPPGTYRLVVSRPSPQALTLPQDAAGRIVVVIGGDRVTGVDLTYRAGGVITGSSRDDHAPRVLRHLAQSGAGIEAA